MRRRFKSDVHRCLPYPVTIVGLGPGSKGSITLEALEALRSSSIVFLRTRHHPIVEFLENEGVKFSSFDDLYEKSTSFDELYEEIKEKLLKAATGAPVVYAVPGNPFVGERSVALLVAELKKMGSKTKVVTGASGLDELFRILSIDPCERGLQVHDALSLKESIRRIDVSVPLIILQMYNRRVASETKLELARRYPEEHRVVAVGAAGTPRERSSEIRLYEVDRLDWIDHLTSLYVPPLNDGGRPQEDGETDFYGFGRLVHVVRQLRGENGCPWDKQQTHQSLKPFVLEEAYEVVEALELDDMHKLREELGDLLLQVVLQAVLAEENSDFGPADVISGIAEKLIRRHPHVFAGVPVNGASEVLRNWEMIKREEKGEGRKGFLSDIPRSLPALMLAFKVQEKVSRVGFDWDNAGEIISKVKEEVGELEEALENADKGRIEDEVGDLLFAVVNLSRFVGMEPEGALRGAISRFIRRFNYIEENSEKEGVRLENLSLEEMNRLWEEAKAQEGG